jgi:hypothetical protein
MHHDRKPVDLHGLDCGRNAGGEAHGGSSEADLRRNRRPATCRAGGQAAKPLERGRRQDAERAPSQADVGATARARPKMTLQRTSLVGRERAGGEPLHRDAGKPVAEHEVLGETIARSEERLLHLRRTE